MARDAGLARISAVTRWLAVAVVGLSGALALIASQAFHGHTVSNVSSTSPASVSQVPSVSAGGVSMAFKSDAEMKTALTALNRKIAAASGARRPPSSRSRPRKEYDP